MAKACNDSGDDRESRRTVVGSGGDCIVCIKKSPKDDDLKIIQIVEGMAHHRNEQRVEMPILMVVHNPHDKPLEMRVVHRAFVEVSLKRFYPSENPQPRDSWERRDPKKKPLMDVLRDLYAGRLRGIQGNPEAALFHQRVNFLGSKQEANMLSLKGPDDCFADKDERNLEPEFDREVLWDQQPIDSSGKKREPSYCSYLLPAIAARKTELFVLWLTLKGTSYQRLIGDSGTFTVDSDARLLRQIRAFDLKNASVDGKKTYKKYIEPEGSILTPTAYDIVVFQGKLGDSIVVATGSICILQVQPKKESLAKQVLWFYGQPEEFYLVLRYGSESLPMSATTGFVVNNYISDQPSPHGVYVGSYEGERTDPVGRKKLGVTVERRRVRQAARM